MKVINGNQVLVNGVLHNADDVKMQEASTKENQEFQDFCDRHNLDPDASLQAYESAQRAMLLEKQRNARQAKRAGMSATASTPGTSTPGKVELSADKKDESRLLRTNHVTINIKE